MVIDFYHNLLLQAIVVMDAVVVVDVGCGRRPSVTDDPGVPPKLILLLFGDPAFDKEIIGILLTFVMSS